MTNRSYLNFDLLLEQEGDGQYQARVTACPIGKQPRVQFRLPFDPTSLENLLLKLDPGRSGVRGVGDDVQQRAAKEFGGPLFQAVFTGPLALAWQGSLHRAEVEKTGGLRLRLRLDDAPDLAGLPWELLYDAEGRAFPAQSERTPLIRFLDVTTEPEPIQVNGPLRVLAIISSPLDLEELDVEREWRGIEMAMAGKVHAGLVVVDRLPEATVDELGEWLLHHETHVIHFVGHGDFNPTNGEGFVYFQDERGGKDAVTAAVLGPFVHDHEPLRMVVLNACRSARTSSRDPYGGMAQGLVQQGAMAVVAMQFPISDPAAVMFTRKFYGGLAAGLPVDQAVGYARKVLQAKYRSEWATPVLFMRSPNGNIFENVQAPPDWVAPDPPVADPPVADPPVADPPVADPPVADPPVADPPVADPPVADPPVADPPVADPPVPPVRPTVGSAIARWMRAHSGLVWGAASFLVVVAGLVTWRLLSGESPPAQDRFADNEVVVAAGQEGFRNQLDLYRVDVDRKTSQQLTTDGQSLLPVLSPDRGSMLYIRRTDDGNELRIVAADGSGDRALFDSDAPAGCGQDASRPAWIPRTDDLVLRCQAEDGTVTLVRVGTDGEDAQEVLRLPDAEFDLNWVGDPTVSPDGRTVVFFGEPLRADSTPRGDGSLYRLDLDSLAVDELLTEGTDGLWAFSDAVFSPTENTLAWRANVAPQGAAADYDVVVATFDSGGLSDRVNISDLAPDGDADHTRDQDPSFSPDGTRLIYGSQTMTTLQDLVVVPLDAPTNQVALEIETDDLPAFRAVPSWSSVAGATE